MSKKSKKNLSLFLATAITFSSLMSVDTLASESSNNLSLERLSGKNRYETSMKIIEKLKSKKLYLANGNTFADALSIGPIAGKEKAGILLTDGKKLDINWLKANSITDITIVGGENSISKELENNLKENFKVTRIAGKNRYETSLKLVENTGINEIAIASGRDFPDALSAAGFLSSKGMPLLLVDGHSLNNISKKFKVVYTIGGEKSIKETLGKRISGRDRYDTSVKIANEFGSYNNLVLASGRTFADALSSTSLASQLSAPIVLTNGTYIPEEITKNKNIKNMILVGGESSISKNIENKLLGKTISSDASSTDNNAGGQSYNIPNYLSEYELNNSKEVTIKDNKLKNAIIGQLKHQNIYKDGQKITEKRMEMLTALDCHLNFTQGRNGGIKSLEGIEYATNIRTLDLGGNEVVDLTPLKGCKKLEVLNLEDQYSLEKSQYLSDISPLGDLVNLKKLMLKNNKIQDLAPISKLTNLEELDLYGNRGIESIAGFEKLTKLKKLLLNRTTGITDISPLSECKNLEELSIQYNKVSSIEALRGHDKLLSLDISGNRNINDLSPLVDSLKLTRLLANTNKISSLEPIKNMVNLIELHISDNQISDLSPLEKLSALEDLDIANNPDITSIEVFKKLTNISELKMHNAMKVKDFSPISSLKNLDDLTITRSGLKDISFLEGLNNITEMSLQSNEITDISPLVNMANLREIKLGFNKIFDASPVSKLRSKFKVAIEMGSQEIEIDATSKLVKNPIVDQKGNKFDINEKENIKNNGENIEITNFDELSDGKKIKVKWGKDAEFVGTLTINIKKANN